MKARGTPGAGTTVTPTTRCRVRWCDSPRAPGLLRTGSRSDRVPVRLAFLAPRTPVSELRLKLFIAGDSPRARAAATNLARVCHEHLDGEPIIETIDVLVHPDIADAYHILTTPTVVREFPLPHRRASGGSRLRCP